MPKMTGLKMPMAPRMGAPKPEMDAIPLQRAPIRANQGKDIISITTRMRETPVKKGR